MVVVDRLTKMIHVEALQSLETEEVAETFYNRIYRYHGLPDSIVSDRGSQFISALWTRLCKRLGIQRRLSTAYHPESDGQTEEANKGIKQYLLSYINYMQDDWARWLAGAEFASNNVESVSTTCTPFLANSGQHPRMGFEPPEPIDKRLPLSERRQMIQADAFVDRMQTLTSYLRDEILIAQAAQEHFANQSRDPHQPTGWGTEYS